MSSKTLPYSIKDIQYDNAKFRPRSFFQVISHTFLTKRMKRECMACSTGKFLALLMICGLTYVVLTHASPIDSITNGVSGTFGSKEGDNSITDGGIGVKRFWRKPPKLPPRLSPDEVNSHNTSIHGLANPNLESEWIARQESVKMAFIHAWSGYKKYAMGYDELMPQSQRGVNGLGGLGATVVDALDTAMIMKLDDVVFEAGSWIEKHLPERISQRGQVNLFETTIRVVGGLLSAYHLSVVQQEGNPTNKGPKPSVYLENAKDWFQSTLGLLLACLALLHLEPPKALPRLRPWKRICSPLKLAEDLAKTCYEMYSLTSTGLAPEIAYFNSEVLMHWNSLFAMPRSQLLL